MKQILFFLGTEAEFIKLFPIMAELEARGIDYRILASGQNEIRTSTLFSALQHDGCDLLLSDPASIEKTAKGLLLWFLRTARHARRTLPGWLKEQRISDALLVVHGDTVSTLMGAWLGHKLKLLPVHVEAGLRSFDYLNPFPEEINRSLVSRYARVHFAPSEQTCRNIRNKRGTIVNTQGNTLLDALAISHRYASGVLPNCVPERGSYFVFVVHRQENIANRATLARFLDEMLEAAKRMPCVLLLHEPTRVALEQFGLIDCVTNQPNVHCVERMEYFRFMELLSGSAYVITDGGSNQEELSYMGKPCLLLRKKTERQDGLGENALLYGGDPSKIGWMSEHYAELERPPIAAAVSPSSVIVDTLEELRRA